MRIVHVVHTMEMGGAESLVAQMARLQRQRGHEVSVLTQRLLGTLGERMREEGFRVEVIGPGHPVARMPRFLQELRGLRPEVVHCHNPAPTIAAAWMARLAGAEMVISTRHSLVAPPYDVAEERRFGAAARACDWVVGICGVTCDNLRRAPMARRDRIVRVYNGANAIAEDATSEGVAREDGVTLLFVGRLAPVKNLEVLLRAFAVARRRCRGLRLWIVGDGHERGRLEAVADQLELRSEDAVRFWGERHDTGGFFRAVDVFAMSSISEGLPMSLLQAMSVGIPALVTDVGGMAEVVRRADCGLRTPVGDVDAMAEAIVHLAEDAAGRRAMGDRGRTAYQREYTLERMEEGYDALYRSKPGTEQGRLLREEAAGTPPRDATLAAQECGSTTS